MPSPFSVNTADLCQHNQYHACCPSCRASDIRFAHKEAVKQKEKREKTGADIRKLLSGDLSSFERKQDKLRFEKQLKQIETQLSEWEKLSEGLRALLSELDKHVQAFCDRHEPDDLKSAFAAFADEAEYDMLRDWQESASTREGEEGGFMQFIPRDPHRDRTFNGLDRSSILATPDMLITEGRGLQIFIKTSKGTNKTFLDALGNDTGGSLMSFGRAIEMFGEPEMPGTDYIRQSASSSASPADSSTVASLEQSMSGVSLGDADEPTNESEWRQRQPHSSPLLTKEQQVDIIGLKNLYLYSGNLASMYNKLATEQEIRDREEEMLRMAEEQNRRQDEDDAENAMEDGEGRAAPKADDALEEASQRSGVGASSVSVSGATGWPLVEKKDFAGYTNWLQRSLEQDPKFHYTTCRPWTDERNKRHDEIKPAINAWKAPAADPSQQLDTTRFYKGPTLLELDMKRVGRETKSVVVDSRGLKRT